VGQTLLIAVAVLIAFDVAARSYFVLKILRIFETKPPFNVPIYPPQPLAETIEFPTTHGLTLRGSLYRATVRPARGLILFLPELDGTHWSAMSYAESLVHAGFDLAAFDFRNQGESDSMPDYVPLHWPTSWELDDARAALKYVRSRSDLRDLPLGLFGISRGSQPALALAAESADVRATCCEGAYGTSMLVLLFSLRWAFLFVPDWLIKLLPKWHFESTLALVRWASEWRRRCRYLVIERILPRLKSRPVLLIAGERDNYVPPEISQRLQACIGDSAEVWIVPQAKHNRAREAEPAEYDRRLVEFFSTHLTTESPASASYAGLGVGQRDPSPA
jgi:pimeloyl-ACP methyl ester carboxylesterase